MHIAIIFFFCYCRYIVIDLNKKIGWSIPIYFNWIITNNNNFNLNWWWIELFELNQYPSHHIEVEVLQNFSHNPEGTSPDIYLKFNKSQNKPASILSSFYYFNFGWVIIIIIIIYN
jgi:hypothetical protein